MSCSIADVTEWTRKEIENSWQTYAEKLELALKRAVNEGCTCDILRDYFCGMHGHLNVMNERPK